MVGTDLYVFEAREASYERFDGAEHVIPHPGDLSIRDKKNVSVGRVLAKIRVRTPDMVSATNDKKRRATDGLDLLLVLALDLRGDLPASEAPRSRYIGGLEVSEVGVQPRGFFGCGAHHHRSVCGRARLDPLRELLLVLGHDDITGDVGPDVIVAVLSRRLVGQKWGRRGIR